MSDTQTELWRSEIQRIAGYADQSPLSDIDAHFLQLVLQRGSIAERKTARRIYRQQAILLESKSSRGAEVSPGVL